MTQDERASAHAVHGEVECEATLAVVIEGVLDGTSNTDTTAELLGVAYTAIGRPHVCVTALDANRIAIVDTHVDGLWAMLISGAPEARPDAVDWYVSEPEGLDFAELAWIGGGR